MGGSFEAATSLYMPYIRHYITCESGTLFRAAARIMRGAPLDTRSFDAEAPDPKLSQYRIVCFLLLFFLFGCEFFLCVDSDLV